MGQAEIQGVAISSFLAGKYLIECLDISVTLSKEDRLKKTIYNNSLDSDGYLSPSFSVSYIRNLIEQDTQEYLNKVNVLMKNYETYTNELNKSKTKAVKYKKDITTKQAELELEKFDNDIVINYFSGTNNDGASSISVDKIYNNKLRSLINKNPLIDSKNNIYFNHLSEDEQEEYVNNSIVKEYTAKNKTIDTTITNNRIEAEFEYDDKVNELVRKTNSAELITRDNILSNINRIINDYVKTFSEIFDGFLINYINNKMVIINGSDLSKLRKYPEISDNVAGFTGRFQELFRVNPDQIDYLLSKDPVTKNILQLGNTTETDFFVYEVDYSYYTDKITSSEKTENWFERVGNSAIKSINQVVEDLNVYIENFNRKIKLTAINIVAAYYKGVFSLRLLTMDKVTKSMSKLPSAEFLDGFKKEIQDIVDSVLDSIISFLSSIKSIIESLGGLVELIMLTSVKGIDLPTDIFSHISFCPNMFDPTDVLVKASYASIMIAVETIKCLSFEALQVEDTCEQVEEDLKKVAAKIIGLLKDDFDYYEWERTLENDRDEAYDELNDEINGLTQDQLFGDVQDVIDGIFDVIMALIIATIVGLIISMVLLMIYKIMTALGKFIPYMLSIGVIYTAYKLFYNCNEYYINKWNSFYNSYHGYIDNNTEIIDYVEDEYGAKLTYLDSVNDLVNGKYGSISSYTNKFKKIIKRYGFEISDKPSNIDLSKGALIINSYLVIEEQINNIFTLGVGTRAIINQIESLAQSTVLSSVTKSWLDNIVDNNEWSEDLFEDGSIFGLDKEYQFDIYKAKDSDDREEYIKASYLNYIESIEDDFNASDITNIVRQVFGITIMGECVAHPDSIFDPLDYTKICEENLSDLNSDLGDGEIYSSYYCQKQENGTYYCVDVEVIDDPTDTEEVNGCFLQSVKKVLTDMATVEDESSLVFSLNVMEFFGIDKVLEIIDLWSQTKDEVNKIIESIYKKLKCYLNKLNGFSCDILFDSEDEEETTVDDNPFLVDLNMDFNSITTSRNDCSPAAQKEVYDELTDMSNAIANNSFEADDQIEILNNVIDQNNTLKQDFDDQIQITKDVVQETSYQIEGEQYEKIKVYSNDLDERTEQIGRKLFGEGPENNTLDDDDEEVKAGAYWNRKLENGLPINPLGYGDGSKKYKHYFKDGNILSKYHDKWKDANGNDKYYGENVNVSKSLGGFDRPKIVIQLLFELIIRTPWEMLLYNNYPDTETFFFLLNFIKMPISWEKVREYILNYKKGDEEKVDKEKVGLTDYLNEMIANDISNINNTVIGGNTIEDMTNSNSYCEIVDDPCPNSDMTIKEKYQKGLITTCDMLNPDNEIELLNAMLDDPDLNKMKELVNSVVLSHPISNTLLPYSDGESLSDRELVIELRPDDDVYCI